ncbi:MAG TPA: type IV secretory system conjugative DNA transfer family protein, partial [Candidatus Dormibacteraeota bacterium]|nr:type IV secretory system conjugative DNA transfer family protein [Candidatus Dormibacteraeota bacterium]
MFAAIAVGVWGVGYVAAAAAAGRPTSGLGAFYRRLLQGLIPPFQANAATPVTRRPALTWWSLEGITHPMSLAIFWLVVAGIAGGAATLAAIAWYNWRGGLPSIGVGPRTARGMSGSSHFASGWELRKLRALGRDNPLGRLVIGYHGPHLLTAPADHHAIVIGVTGKGKTVAYAIPAVLEWPGPVVAVSVKTDLIEHTVGARQRAGRV